MEPTRAGRTGVREATTSVTQVTDWRPCWVGTSPSSGRTSRSSGLMIRDWTNNVRFPGPRTSRRTSTVTASRPGLRDSVGSTGSTLWAASPHHRSSFAAVDTRASMRSPPRSSSPVRIGCPHDPGSRTTRPSICPLSSRCRRANGSSSKRGISRETPSASSGSKMSEEVPAADVRPRSTPPASATTRADRPANSPRSGCRRDGSRRSRGSAVRSDGSAGASCTG